MTLEELKESIKDAVDRPTSLPALRNILLSLAAVVASEMNTNYNERP
jgi:hypothetical protein